MSDQQLQTPMPKAANPLANYFRQPKLFVRLPSQGKFYLDGSLDKSQNDEYAVYAMTAKDELMFKTPDALMNGQATVEVIKSCVPAIKNPWNMPSIDLDAVLIAIRMATYGEKMEITASCPDCSHRNEYEMNLLNHLDRCNSFEFKSVIDYPPLKVNIRPYSYQEITKAQIKTLEQQKIFAIVNDENMPDEEKVARFGESFVKLTELTVDVVSGCIQSIETPEGIVTDQKMIKEFIENAPSEIFNKINDHIGKMKEEISLKSHKVNCQECNFEYEVEIGMDQTNFFGVGS